MKDKFICGLDGVGGWADEGIDSGLMTKELITHISEMYDKREFETLHTLLDDCVKKTVSKGSTTAVMAEIPNDTPNDPTKVKIKTLNLGDSGYLILRPQPKNQTTSVVFRSESQQHYFNCPFQVGNHSKLPTKSDLKEHIVDEKDIFVMATDGVWDNLFNEDI